MRTPDIESTRSGLWPDIGAMKTRSKDFTCVHGVADVFRSRFHAPDAAGRSPAVGSIAVSVPLRLCGCI
jgi:hypothetical protein